MKDTWFTDIPNARSTIPGSRSKNVGMPGIPSGGVHTITVFLECPHTRWPVHSPQLHRVIPGGAQKGVLSNGIEVDAMGLPSVLV